MNVKREKLDMGEGERHEVNEDLLQPMNDIRFVDWDNWWNVENKYGRCRPWLSNKRESDPTFKKLNVGSGSKAYNPDRGWVNMDYNDGPGILNHDIQDMPWPFEDDHFDYIHMSNILEHLDPQLWFLLLGELFRISKNGTYWEIHGPDPRNVVVTLQQGAHITTIGPWTFHNLIFPAETGDLNIGYMSRIYRLTPIDCDYNSDRPLSYNCWSAFYMGPITDWHLRRYLGRRIGDTIAKIFGLPWTLRLVYRVGKRGDL